jgi:hypothetical protein
MLKFCFGAAKLIALYPVKCYTYNHIFVKNTVISNWRTKNIKDLEGKATCRLHRKTPN